MKKLPLFLIVFTSFIVSGQDVGSITAIQEVTNDNGNIYYHDINEGIFRRNNPEKQNPAMTPFLANSNFAAQTEGAEIGSVKFIYSNNNHVSDDYNFEIVIDNEPPFTLREDENNASLYSRIPRGSISVTAVPYSGDNATGLEGASITVSCQLWDIFNEFTNTLFVKDATDDSKIAEIISGQENTISIDEVSNKIIDFEVFKKEGFISYFNYSVIGPNLEINAATPLFSNETTFPSSQDNSEIKLEVGSYTVSAKIIAWTGDHNIPNPSIDAEWSFTITESNQLKTYIPDNNFEQALIDLGYDDVLDDYVLTANIESITSLNISGKGIDDLTGIGNFQSITSLNIANNNITVLDISQLTELTVLKAQNNSIVDLDLTNNQALSEVVLSHNELEFLNIKNGNNQNITSFDTSVNLNLYCIEVDDPSNIPPSWFKGVLTRYATNCTIDSDINPDAQVVGFKTLEFMPYGLLADYRLSFDMEDGRYFDRVYDYFAGSVPNEFEKTTNIIALTENGNPGSMSIQIDGPISFTRTDNQAPFTLFEIEDHQRFPEGLYSLTATPYSEANLEGNPGEPYTINFILVDESVLLSAWGTVFNEEGEEWEIAALTSGSATPTSPIIPSDIPLNFNNTYDGNLLEFVEFTLVRSDTTIIRQDFSAPFNMFNENGEDNFSGVLLEPGEYALTVSGKTTDSFRRVIYSPTWRFTIIDTPEDADGDGVVDSEDICPDTPTGEAVNAQGCSLSQLADLAIQNISIGMGSDPCSDTPSAYVNIGVRQDVEINVTILQNNAEQVFDGPVSMANPLFLENLTEGEYSICASNPNISGFEQCYQVSYSATENRVDGTIIMQNPNQEYTISASGSTEYLVVVNNNPYYYTFDSTDVQQITFPLVAGINTISLEGALECAEEGTLTYVPDDNFEQTLIDLGYDNLLDDYVLTSILATISEIDFQNAEIADLTGIEDMINLESLRLSNGSFEAVDLSKNILLEILDIKTENLKTIDLTNNTELRLFAAPFSGLESVDLSQNTKLEVVILFGNELQSLDFSNHATLSTLDIADNKLTKLNLSGATNLIEFSVQNNSELSCIQVANVEDALAQTDWFKDDTASYAVDCSQGADSDGLVDDSSFEDKILAYPTLTNGKITIANPNEEEIGTISVVTMNGKNIMAMPIFDNPRGIDLDISSHTKGMYIIHVGKMNGKDNFIKVILD